MLFILVSRYGEVDENGNRGDLPEVRGELQERGMDRYPRQ